MIITQPNEVTFLITLFLVHPLRLTRWRILYNFHYKFAKIQTMNVAFTLFTLLLSFLHQYEGGVETRGINNWDVYTHKYSGPFCVFFNYLYIVLQFFFSNTKFSLYSCTYVWNRIKILLEKTSYYYYCRNE